MRGGVSLSARSVDEKTPLQKEKGFPQARWYRGYKYSTLALASIRMILARAFLREEEMPCSRHWKRQDNSWNRGNTG